MIKIGVCIIDKNFESHIIGLIHNILPEYDDLATDSIPAEALLKRKREMFPDYPVYVLDEQLLRKNGVETAEYLSRIRPNDAIIFVEGNKESVVSGFRYHVYAYRLQRLKQSDLKAVIAKKYREFYDNPKSIIIRCDGEDITIPLKNIMYVESRNRHIILHTLTGEYEYWEKMRNVEMVLASEGFVRCHQSFIVSKRYVTKVSTSEIWLEQICLPVGRTYRDNVKRELFRDTLEANDFHNADELDKEYGDYGEKTGNLNDKRTEKQGILMGLRGKYEGVEFNFRSEERILIGRSELAADIILCLPLISRIHCVVIYHEDDNMYEVMDFSKNGIYLSGKKRLAPDTSYLLKPGTRISFGDNDNEFCLG